METAVALVLLLCLAGIVVAIQIRRARRRQDLLARWDASRGEAEVEAESDGITDGILRRSFIAGLGSVSVGLLFLRRPGVPLGGSARAPGQLPVAAEIVARPQSAFRPRRLVVPDAIAPGFEIEDVVVGGISQFSCAAPAELFSSSAYVSPVQLPALAPGTEIRLRVRYTGDDPRGAVFQAALIGESADECRHMLILPISSMEAIGPASASAA